MLTNKQIRVIEVTLNLYNKGVPLMLADVIAWVYVNIGGNRGV